MPSSRVQLALLAALAGAGVARAEPSRSVAPSSSDVAPSSSDVAPSSLDVAPSRSVAPSSSVAPLLSPSPSRSVAPLLSPAPAPSVAQPASAPTRRIARQDKARITAGTLLFAVPYVASALWATSSYETPDGASPARAALWIPAAGPWLELGRGSTGARVALVADGVAQLAGLAALGWALATPAWVRVGAPRAHVALVPTGAGGALIGRF